MRLRQSAPPKCLSHLSFQSASSLEVQGLVDRFVLTRMLSRQGIPCRRCEICSGEPRTTTRPRPFAQVLIDHQFGLLRSGADPGSGLMARYRSKPVDAVRRTSRFTVDVCLPMFTPISVSVCPPSRPSTIASRPAGTGISRRSLMHIGAKVFLTGLRIASRRVIDHLAIRIHPRVAPCGPSRRSRPCVRYLISRASPRLTCPTRPFADPAFGLHLVMSPPRIIHEAFGHQHAPRLRGSMPLAFAAALIDPVAVNTTTICSRSI